ncbi:hypothetical protein V2J09_005640 [Rumex salicifolius]
MEMPNIFQRLSHFLHTLIIFLLPKHLTHAPAAAAHPPENTRRRPALHLRQVFDTFDENKDGLITKAELSNSLHNMGIPISDSDLTRLIERVDANGDECVDVAEFESLYRHVEASDGEGHVEEAFGVFDKDGDGFISEEELRRVLETLGLERGVEECRRMIANVDVDGDGRISFMEFQLMMKDVNCLSLIPR